MKTARNILAKRGHAAEAVTACFENSARATAPPSELEVDEAERWPLPDFEDAIDRECARRRGERGPGLQVPILDLVRRGHERAHQRGREHQARAFERAAETARTGKRGQDR